MKRSKRYICSFFVLTAFIGSAIQKQLSIPLQQKQNGDIFMTVEYGLNKCQLTVVPGLDCSNTVIAKSEAIEACGAQEMKQDPPDSKPQIFSALFQLGSNSGTLIFDNGGSDVSTTTLCFGSVQKGLHFSAITQLLYYSKISKQIVYYNINQKPENIENPVVGSLDIGEPNESLLKYGEFIRLVKKENYGPFVTTLRGFSISGTKLSGSILSIDPTQTTIIVNSQAYKDILSSITESGVTITRKIFSDEIILDSLDKLKPISLSLLGQNDTVFQIYITPSQYTRKVAQGYLLDIQYKSNDNQVRIGASIFTSYYIGFDAIKGEVLIAEKSQQCTNNFRESS